MKKTLLFAAMAVLLCLGGVQQATAQELTSVKDVQASEFARDFEYQGEYITPEDGRAFQLIADGNGKFRVVGYPGGLPGEGWDRSMARFFGTAEIVGDRLVITGQKMNIPKRVKEGKEADVIFDAKQKARELFVTKDGDELTFHYKGERAIKKVDRKSPTLGMPAPEGAFVVFNGKDVKNFKPGAKLNAEAGTLWSEATSVPFEKKPYLLHLEFMTSFMPTKQSQARSNSGVYIAECYECQVLDSFGLDGKNNECGGFYQQTEPIVNMCFPPLTWQTYDIDFTPAKYENGKKVANARVTVMHNGIMIQYDLELPQQTPGRLKEADEARGVYLQGHGNKVQYRNIWVQYK
ncbi:MAG: DUF1080 domain-containing protein [Planctomycetia bacterium]|nr:DUF1080 domain-containing protein [Planctomycetia bacterium]